MDYNVLADLLLPNSTMTREDVFAKFPKRNLKEGAQVTRMAPSPTGFIHLGNLYSALADERIAHLSDGVFYLRIEDTDLKRKVEGAVDIILSILFGIVTLLPALSFTIVSFELHPTIANITTKTVVKTNINLFFISNSPYL